MTVQSLTGTIYEHTDYHNITVLGTLFKMYNILKRVPKTSESCQETLPVAASRFRRVFSESIHVKTSVIS